MEVQSWLLWHTMEDLETMQRRGVSSASDLYKMPQETQNYVPKVMGYYRDGI